MAVGVPSTAVLTPGNKNYAQSKRFVVNYVQGADDAELLDLAGDEFNNGIDRLNARVWNWNIKRQDITLVASTAEYDISSDHKKPRKLQLLDSSSYVVKAIGYCDTKTFWERHSNSATAGAPDKYTIETPLQRGKLVLDPIPGASFVSSYPTARLQYYARVEHLTQDADVLKAPPEVWQFVAWYARWALALDRAAPANIVDRAYAHWRELENLLIRDDKNVVTDWGT